MTWGWRRSFKPSVRGAGVGDKGEETRDGRWEMGDCIVGDS